MKTTCFEISMVLRLLNHVCYKTKLLTSLSADQIKAGESDWAHEECKLDAKPETE